MDGGFVGGGVFWVKENGWGGGRGGGLDRNNVWFSVVMVGL